MSMRKNLHNARAARIPKTASNIFTALSSF